jgi:hypothetical protein
MVGENRIYRPLLKEIPAELQNGEQFVKKEVKGKFLIQKQLNVRHFTSENTMFFSQVYTSFSIKN